MSQTTDMESAVVEARVADLKDKADEIYTSLVLGGEHGRLPEDIFKNYFLPYFSGAKQIDSATITQWVSIAGTPMSEVDILDTAGNVLYSVPALYDTNMFEIAQRDPGKSIADIANEYELRNHSLPRVANRYLTDALSAKLGEIAKSDKPVDANAARWNSILERYGAQPVNENKTSSSSSSGEDDLVYE